MAKTYFAVYVRRRLTAKNSTAGKFPNSCSALGPSKWLSTCLFLELAHCLIRSPYMPNQLRMWQPLSPLFCSSCCLVWPGAVIVGPLSPPLVPLAGVGKDGGCVHFFGFVSVFGCAGLQGRWSLQAAAIVSKSISPSSSCSSGRS